MAETTSPPGAESGAADQDGRAPDRWPAICEQFALRVLAASYHIGTHLEAAEADEQDPERLDKLYRIDHANTRVRRQAENLQVLVGRRVEDAGRQVTSLLDVVRASASAIEHYARIQVGQIVDLAVVDFAADDVIRVLTELLDNAARFSPPATTVIVSGYITEHGSVLLRVEDWGVGVSPDQLPVLNAMLAGDAVPALDGDPAAHLGLVVVRRLATAHQLRVQLTARQSAGTTATVLIPDRLLCEIPPPDGAGSGRAAGSGPAAGLGPAVVAEPFRAAWPANRPANRPAHRATQRPAQRPAHRPAQWPSQRPPTAAETFQGTAQVPASHLMLVDDDPAGDAGQSDAGRPANAGPVDGSHGLPRREPASLRGEPAPARAPAPAEPAPRQGAGAHRQSWPDETADFAAGISDAHLPITGQSSEGYLP